MDESNKNKKNNASGVIIFLALFALLLAIGGALLLREVLSAKYEAQVAARENSRLTSDKQNLEQQLNDIDARYAQMSQEYGELEKLFEAERYSVNQLKSQLRGEGSAGMIAQYRQRIKELEEQLEAYRLQLEALENDNLALSGENGQIRESLAQYTAENQRLDVKNKEMAEQLLKASLLTISNLEGTAMRERRRGDEPTTSAKKTDKLRICFDINQNLVTAPGNRDYYIRLVNPANQVLTISPDNTLPFEGENIQYSIKRTINYQNNAQQVCAVWNQKDKFQKGYYNIVVFEDGKEAGYKLFALQ
jgi:regulator of replication initiation timing